MKPSYLCQCRVIDRGPSDCVDDVPRDIWALHLYHELNALYYCNACKSIKCHRCTENSITSVYCPSCLNEFALGSTHAHFNRCTRHCLKCPECSCMSMAARESVKHAKKIIVSCHHCKWKCGALFNRKPSLANQVAARTQNNDQFETLKRKYMSTALSDLIGLVMDGDSTTPSKDTTPNTKLPDLVTLVPKLTRRCKACRSLLIQPESSDPLNAKLRTKSLARDHLARLTLSLDPQGPPHGPQNEILAHKEYEFLLTVSNPLTQPVAVSLSTVPASLLNGLCLTIPHSTFRLGGNPKDESDVGIVASNPSLFVARKTKATTVVDVEGLRRADETDSCDNSGVKEQGKNWITLILRLQVSKSTNQSLVRAPIFVSMTSNQAEIGYWVMLTFASYAADLFMNDC